MTLVGHVAIYRQLSKALIWALFKPYIVLAGTSVRRRVQFYNSILAVNGDGLHFEMAATEDRPGTDEGPCGKIL
jgi:hypothetical protein